MGPELGLAKGLSLSSCDLDRIVGPLVSHVCSLWEEHVVTVCVLKARGGLRQLSQENNCFLGVVCTAWEELSHPESFQSHTAPVPDPFL
jgi:hypothetical protein